MMAASFLQYICEFRRQAKPQHSRWMWPSARPIRCWRRMQAGRPASLLLTCPPSHQTAVMNQGRCPSALSRWPLESVKNTDEFIKWHCVAAAAAAADDDDDERVSDVMHSAMPSVQCVRDCASLIAQLLPASRTGRAAHARAPCQPIWPMLYVLITRSKRQTLPTLQGCRLCFIDNDYREFYAECPEKQQKFPIKSSLFSQSIICYIFTTKKNNFYRK